MFISLIELSDVSNGKRERERERETGEKEQKGWREKGKWERARPTLRVWSLNVWTDLMFLNKTWNVLGDWNETINIVHSSKFEWIMKGLNRSMLLNIGYSYTLIRNSGGHSIPILILYREFSSPFFSVAPSPRILACKAWKRSLESVE